MSKKKITQAVILAAGNRKEFDKPVGLLEIEDFKIIDRQIAMLRKFGMEKIIIVTGYKAEFFEELAQRYAFVELVVNSDYKWTGNMASLSLTKSKLEGDFLLLENDLVFENLAIDTILNSEFDDCVLVTSESGSGDEAFVEIRKGCIYKLSKDIHQFNKIDGEMIGISKISAEFFNLMLDEFSMNVNPYVNYEYIMLDIARERELYACKADDLVWGEIDNKKQYELIVKNVMPRLRRREMASKIDEVKSILVSALGIDIDDIRSVSPIGGMTNNNYKVRTVSNEYVIRVPGAGTSEMISRQSEAKNSVLVAKVGIDANILYYDENTGTKISEMIKDARTVTAAMAKQPGIMVMTTRILKKLHNSGIEMENEFNVFKNIELYENILNNLGGTYYEGYDELREKVFSLKEILEKKGTYLAPCHCDTVPENFITDRSDRYYLIDWEYSGLNDPMWDLAAHSIECGFTEEEEELLLNLYFDNKEHEDSRIRVEIFKLCQDFLWSIWTLIKEKQGEDFGTYGIDRYNRCLENIDKLNNML
ncbi:MAG: phosphotransferase [Sarcina sp.]